MTASSTQPGKVSPSKEWVFPWRPLGSPLFPKFIALAIVAAAFTLLISTVRIHLVSPERISPRKASLIYLGDDSQSRALALRAQEDGPFPSRFELSDWQSLAESEQRAFDAVRYQIPPYAPVLSDLPLENLSPPILLAPRGKAFFPDRPAPADVPPPVRTDTEHRMEPRLYPLSATATAVMPESLPTFPAAVDPVMTAASWRFLICLNPAGTVTHCVSLEKGGETAAETLCSWLRQVSFKSQPGSNDRWIALAIGFIHPSEHGPDTR